MKKIIGVTIVVVAALFFLPWKKVNWGRVSFVPAETVTVSGEAKSIQKNQIATFSAGADAVNDKKETAVAEVNQKVAAIIKGAKDFGIQEADIKTQSISIYQSEEVYYDNGVQKNRKGQWRVSNTVEITLREVDRAAALADILTSSGATNVYGPNFRMDDTNAAEKGLYDEAMKDAQDKAQIIATSAGRKLGKVLSVNDNGTNNNVIYPMMAKSEGMGGASVETGSTTVSKTMTVSFELE
jgi:uncharacterized protein